MTFSGTVVNISLAIFLIIGMIIFIVTNRQVDEGTNIYFIIYIIIVSLLLFFEVWEYYLSSLKALNTMRYFTTAMGYTLRVSAITVMNMMMHPNNKKWLHLWFPVIVLSVLAFTNQYTHLICYFTHDNYYRGSYLKYLPHIISAVCMAILIFDSEKNRKETKSKPDVLFIFIISINVFATVVETVSSTKFLLTGTMMISCVFYYSIVNKQNEARKITLHQQQLAQEKIAITLSQIQPHFLYNTITSICYLCDKDPQMAKETLENFSVYLRGNLDSLKRTTPIPFFKGLEHVETYISLEKVRFPKTLNVKWDIAAANFMLPALSVQPLVENAVKYGIGKKYGGGTVTISTCEKETYFEVKVIDDGAGFDTKAVPDDRRSHIGIENVRLRLAAICNGTLEIYSETGRGTEAVIKIPKEVS